MSLVFYKFKSAKDYDTCTFDGTGISVFDLKREIMINKKLGKGTDFDLAVYNAQDDANEYADDNHVIGRNTSILVARKPAAKPGKGTAQKYLNMAPAAIAAMANGPLSYGARPMMPIVRPVRPPTDQPAADDIALMFKQQDQHWQKTQDSMAA